MKSDPTIERLNFSSYSNTTVEHLHRYAITQDLIKNKVVLDIASGEGYGAFLMSKFAKYVYGVDINSEAVLEAQEKYWTDNLRFLEGSADKISLEENSVDVVVSFETIEHHDKHKEMFDEIIRVLKPNGVLIMSSPDKTYYSDKTGYKNRFHVKELYFKEFKLLAESYFEFAEFYFQKAYNFNSYIARNEFFNSVKIYSGDEKNINSEEIEPLYNIVIASNKPLAEVETSIYNGEGLANKRNKHIITQTILKVKNSITFKIGYYILKPFSKLLRR